MSKASRIAIHSKDDAYIARVVAALQPQRLVRGLDTANDADIVIVDARGDQLASALAALNQFAEKTIVYSDHSDLENINQILDRYGVFHLIGANGCDPMVELQITVRKMQEDDFFGLKSYFGSHAKINRGSIDDAQQIKPVIEGLLGHLDLKETFAATHEFLTLTFNELVTNAVYNAPVDQLGQPRYEKTDRTVKVKLESHEKVELAVCDNDKCIGILVQDQFGRLGRDKIVRHLVKCVNNTAFIEEKKGGAGAGIYLAFHTSSQLIVNIDPGHRLEVICLVEKNKRYKEYRSRITSFNYFVKSAVKKEGAV